MKSVIKQLMLLAIMVLVLNIDFINVSAESKEKVPENKAINTESSAITQGLRWPESEDKKEWLTIKMPDGGIRIVDQNNQNEFLAIDSYGGIYLNGDLYLNGQSFKEYIQGSREEVYNRENVILVFLSVIFIFLAILIIMAYKYKKNYEKLSKKIETINIK